MITTDLNPKYVYYLASPYSTPHVTGVTGFEYKKDRYDKIVHIGSQLFKLKINVIEPIATSHVMSLRFSFEENYKAWRTRDEALMRVSDGMLIATIEGWQHSNGVGQEIDYMSELNKPMFLVHLNDRNEIQSFTKYRR